MWEVMNVCVILDNTIIEIEGANLVHNDLPYDWEGPLAQVDHEVLAEFGTFLQNHCEICDQHTQQQLRDVLVVHLWASRGNTA
jgi:hypothetical protein